MELGEEIIVPEEHFGMNFVKYPCPSCVTKTRFLSEISHALQYVISQGFGNKQHLSVTLFVTIHMAVTVSIIGSDKARPAVCDWKSGGE